MGCQSPAPARQGANQKSTTFTKAWCSFPKEVLLSQRRRAHFRYGSSRLFGCHSPAPARRGANQTNATFTEARCSFSKKVQLSQRRRAHFGMTHVWASPGHIIQVINKICASSSSEDESAVRISVCPMLGCHQVISSRRATGYVFQVDPESRALRPSSTKHLTARGCTLVQVSFNNEQQHARGSTQDEAPLSLYVPHSFAQQLSA